MGITTARAIKVIGIDGKPSGEGTQEEYLEAVKLGRECLRGHLKFMKSLPKGVVKLLPGELEE